jgi:hypothetical protein
MIYPIRADNLRYTQRILSLASRIACFCGKFDLAAVRFPSVSLPCSVWSTTQRRHNGRDIETLSCGFQSYIVSAWS